MATNFDPMSGCADSAPWDEAARLAALGRYAVLDTPAENLFDEIAALAADVCGTSAAAVSFAADGRQWLKAAVGIGARELPIEPRRRPAFLRRHPFVVTDAAEDPGCANDALAEAAGGARFYAGAPLVTPEGLPVGALCVLDPEPRPQGLTERQGRVLEMLARQAMSELELRRALAERETEVARARAAERRFRAFAEAMPAMVFASSRGHNRYVNNRFVEYTGLSADALLGEGWRRAIHPDDVGAFGSASGGPASEGRGLEVRVRRADGAWRWHLVRSRRSEADDGDTWIGAAVDVHERHEAEVRLRDSEALLSAVLDALPVGVIIADASGRILRDNAANRELWGVPPETEDWTGYGEWVGYRPETGERIGAGEWAMSRALLRGEVVRNELVENERFGTRERRFYLNNAAPVRDAEGRIVGGVVAELDVTERLATERALAAKEIQLRTILETVPVGIVMAELPSGRIVEGNAHVEKMLRHPVLPSADIDSYDEWVSYHPDGRRVEGHEYPLARMVREGAEAPELEVHYQRGDGTRAWTRIMGRAVRNEAGELVGGVVALVDIDAERRTVEEFQTLADNIPTLCWMAYADGHVYWYNRRWHDYTGTSPSDLDGWGWESVHDPEVLPTVVERWKHSLATGEPFEMTFPLKGGDGAFRPFLTRVVPIRNEAGEIVRWFGTNVEVGALVRAQDELRRTTSLLRLIGDSTPDLIYAKDRESRILYANAAVQKTVGKGPDEIVGLNDRDWAGDPAEAEAIIANDRRVVETGETVDIDETFTGSDGRTRHYRTVKAPLRDETGRIIGLVGTTSDVTERREAEERERLLAREVDHRAKNLLAVVQSVVQLTRAEDMAGLKAAINGRVQALARAHSLLAAGRWEGVELRRLVEEEMAPFGRGDEPRLRVDGPALRLKPAAAQALALALHELATNAAKYGALSIDAGRVEVTWSRAKADGGARLELSWRERGGPPVRAPERRGFGSTVIKNSVERQLGGSVSLDWRETGLVCDLVLPATELLATREAPPPRDASPVAPAASGSLKDKRVLVVEDEALVAMQIEGALAQAGADVVGPAAGVDEALAALNDRAPDLAVLDVNLGGVMSYPVADALRARGIPFVFSTGYAAGHALPRRLAGATVLPKPVDVADLLRTLERLGA